MPRFDLVVVVPLYNEEGSLNRLKSEMDKFISDCRLSVYVLFVDDGSGDNSLSIVRGIAGQDSNYGYISLERNMGLSAALKAGIDNADSRWVGYIDSDLQTNPSDFGLLLPYAEDYDLVTGYRQNRNDPLVKRISSRIANSFRRAVLKDGVRDTGCPLKIIKTETARRIPFFSGMHRFIPALVQAQGGVVKEVPVRHFERLEGVSKYNLANRLVKPFIDTLAVLWIKKRTISYKLAQGPENNK